LEAVFNPTLNPTISPTTQCAINWTIQIKFKLIGYVSTDDNWQNSLKSQSLEAFKQTVVFLTDIQWNDAMWCILLSTMQFKSDINRRRVLLQNNIEIEQSFNYNDNLHDAYFGKTDDFNSTTFSLQYQRSLKILIERNKDIIEEIEEFELGEASPLVDGEGSNPTSSPTTQPSLIGLYVLLGVLPCCCLFVAIVLFVRKMKYDRDIRSIYEPPIHHYQQAMQDDDDATSTDIGIVDDEHDDNDDDRKLI